MKVPPRIELPNVVIQPRIKEGRLVSLGSVAIGGQALRHAQPRWLPWCDTLEG